MGTLKSSLSSGLAKGPKAAEKQKRKGQQTAGGGKKSAAAYSAAPAKRHAEETETVKSESTPVYTAAKKSSSANAAVASSMHYSSSGSKHGGSHGSLGEVSVYEQRRQQRDAARKDFWNHTLDLLGTASAQAQRGALRVSVPVGLQIEEARRQEDNIRAIREANARFEATRQPIEWDGRAELISALEQLDMQSGWEINEEQANAAEQQRQTGDSAFLYQFCESLNSLNSSRSIDISGSHGLFIIGQASTKAPDKGADVPTGQIGRASCRERV